MLFVIDAIYSVHKQYEMARINTCECECVCVFIFEQDQAMIKQNAQKMNSFHTSILLNTTLNKLVSQLFDLCIRLYFFIHILPIEDTDFNVYECQKHNKFVDVISSNLDLCQTNLKYESSQKTEKKYSIQIRKVLRIWCAAL